jgi:hypothetical protein
VSELRDTSHGTISQPHHTASNPTNSLTFSPALLLLPIINLMRHLPRPSGPEPFSRVWRTRHLGRGICSTTETSRKKLDGCSNLHPTPSLQLAAMTNHTTHAYLSASKLHFPPISSFYPMSEHGHCSPMHIRAFTRSRVTSHSRLGT